VVATEVAQCRRSASGTGVVEVGEGQPAEGITEPYSGAGTDVLTPEAVP
jgi:hypothetical protein